MNPTTLACWDMTDLKKMYISLSLVMESVLKYVTVHITYLDHFELDFFMPEYFGCIHDNYDCDVHDDNDM